MTGGGGAGGVSGINRTVMTLHRIADVFRVHLEGYRYSSAFRKNRFKRLGPKKGVRFEGACHFTIPL